ncbi:MAG: BatA domain-containing protein [Planctomycetota bacterium]
MSWRLVHPWLLLALPLAGLLLYLLERWRRRPLRVVVADLALFRATPESEAEARATRRRLERRFWLRLLAAALLSLALADPRAAFGPPGPLELDLVLERGLAAGARAADGRERVAGLAAELARVLEDLRPDDRVRLHLVPGPPAALASPAEALARLGAVVAVGAPATPGPLLAALAARARAGGPPAFFAGTRAPAGSEGLALALRGGPVRNRAIVGLAAEDGALWVTLLARDAAGPVRVELAARREGGALVTRSLSGELPAQGALRLRWDEVPADAVEVSARLTGPPDAAPLDEVAGDDRAFAVRPAVPPRRVGVVGEVSEPVLRALRAAPGARVERLTDLDARGLDLVVCDALPAALPDAALLVVPREPAAVTVAGGPLRGQPHPAFPYTLAQLERDPAEVARLGPAPEGLPGARPLLLAGAEPLLLLSGAGRRLVAVARAPLDGRSGTWVSSASFPLFVAELLELGAPRAEAALAAHPAGEPHPALATPPLEVRRYADAAGRPLLGTVAPPLASGGPAVTRDFTSSELARVEAARPPAPSRPLAPWLALSALLPALLAWAPGARPGAEPGAEGSASRIRASLTRAGAATRADPGMAA